MRGNDMDVEPLHIQGIFRFRDAPKRRERRKNRTRKREDQRSETDQPHDDDEHNVDLIA